MRQILHDYTEFKMCREFGRFPHEFDELPARMVEQWKIMFAAENEAEQWLIDNPKAGRR